MKFYDFDEITQAGDCIQFVTTVLGLTINREGRCQAVWRGGDGYNVALKKDGWYDHKTKEGGGLKTSLASIRIPTISSYRIAYSASG